MITECFHGECPQLSNGRCVCDVLPGCGCGRPERLKAAYIRILESCCADRWGQLDNESDVDEILLNVLGSFGLTEHGATIWCSWLTPKGEEFLAVAAKHWAQPEASR